MKIKPGKNRVLVTLTPKESMALAQQLIKAALASGAPVGDDEPETEHKPTEEHGQG